MFVVKIGIKFSKRMKGELRLGVEIIQKRGRENIFNQVFGEIGEKLLKASQCYLSTNASPIVRILFIAIQKTTFYNDRSITLRSPMVTLFKNLTK